MWYLILALLFGYPSNTGSINNMQGYSSSIPNPPPPPPPGPGGTDEGSEGTVRPPKGK